MILYSKRVAGSEKVKSLHPDPSGPIMCAFQPRELLRFLCLVGLLLALPVVRAIMQGTKFANVTVWGAMIVTDPKISRLLGGKNKNYVERRKQANQRRKQAEETTRLLPFPLVEWPSMYVQDCPGFIKTTRNQCRGVSMAHYQIWADWEYQGRLGSNKAYASDSDVLVVFEDDAVITVKNITQSLEQELSPGTMKSDYNLLGWCYEDENKYTMPLCTHAYAVTRAGVKKILAAWNICSPNGGIDIDMRVMAWNHVFSWQIARPESYSDRLGQFANFGGITRGIFVQKAGFVSFNSNELK